MARTAICNLILGKNIVFICGIYTFPLRLTLYWEITSKPCSPQQEVHLQRSTATSGWWRAGRQRDSEVSLAAVSIYPVSYWPVGFPLIYVDELGLTTQVPSTLASRWNHCESKNMSETQIVWDTVCVSYFGFTKKRVYFCYWSVWIVTFRIIIHW